MVFGAPAPQYAQMIPVEGLALLLMTANEKITGARNERPVD